VCIPTIVGSTRHGKRIRYYSPIGKIDGNYRRFVPHFLTPANRIPAGRHDIMRAASKCPFTELFHELAANLLRDPGGAVCPARRRLGRPLPVNADAGPGLISTSQSTSPTRLAANEECGARGTSVKRSVTPLDPLSGAGIKAYGRGPSRSGDPVGPQDGFRRGITVSTSCLLCKDRKPGTSTIRRGTSPAATARGRPGTKRCRRLVEGARRYRPR
jgi:hypothetical protein